MSRVLEKKETILIKTNKQTKMNDQYTTYINYFRNDNQNNAALTQVIPMDVFEADEKNVRKFVKEIGGRIYFRGPRRAYSQDTLRKNAKGIVIYA